MWNVGLLMKARLWTLPERVFGIKIVQVSFLDTRDIHIYRAEVSNTQLPSSHNSVCKKGNKTYNIPHLSFDNILIFAVGATVS